LSDSSPVSQTAPPRLHFRVPPEPSHLLRARDRIRDYLHQYCAERQVINDVVLCIGEAATNAICHSGSAQDIEMSLRFMDGDLVAEVRDRGRGFDVAGFDREAPPDISSEHGRGLFLISRLCDGMELWRDGGLEVRMIKKAVEPREAVAPGSGLSGLRTPGNLDFCDVRPLALLDKIGEGFVALDWDYRYVHVNAEALLTAGKSLEEMIGRRPWELASEVAGSALERAYRDAMELGRPSIIEYRMAVRGAWAEIRIYPTPTGVSAYFREIDERKRKESERDQYLAALRESEENYQAVVGLNGALAQVVRAIHGSLTFADVVQTALSEGAAVIGAETAAVTLHDDQAKGSRVAYTYNVPPDKLGILVSDVDDRHGVEAMRTGQTLAVSDTHDDSRVVVELMDAWDIKSVICAPDTHVVVLIGDVAGKGVRAAGHTETVRAKLQAFATIEPSPAFVLAKTNELLLRFNPDDPHVTAFDAVLDPHTGHLSYARAGHPAPVHLGASSCRTLESTFGPPLGSFEHSYANAHATLALEDYLVLYTDGVTEARRGAELLGEQRLLETVRGLRGRSAQEVAEGVRDAALAFAGKLRDDLQVVVLRRA
jgi:anti-sigma regulatory factor (Ser/Thr protein kinase)